MVGAGLQKLARNYGMKVDSGVAYGSLMGFATTLSEGSGWKRIDVATKFPTTEQKGAFLNAVEAVEVAPTYRVQKLGLNARSISIIFHDTVGTMKRIEAFIDWFYPLLKTHGAESAAICSRCSAEVTEDSWYLVDGIAYCLHENCAEHIREELGNAAQQRKEEDTGSYVQGTVGAFLGAALGAVVWALVLLGGYVASLVGLLIGWLAEKGYNLLRGKQSKGKVVILILAIIFGVVLGTLAADGISLAQMIGNGELPGFTYGDIPGMILSVLIADADYRGGVLANMGMGLLFAALGVFALLRKAGKEVSNATIKKLK